MTFTESRKARQNEPTARCCVEDLPVTVSDTASAGGGEETLHVIEAADENDIRARQPADPWAPGGVIPTESERCLVALGGS